MMASASMQWTAPPLEVICLRTVVFGVAATLLHSAACVLSDICDVRFDSQVGQQMISRCHV